MEFTHNTIDDKIVRDGLSAVATLADNLESRDSYFVVGGIATQSYLPTSCRRPTSDIDLAVLKPLNREGFHNYARTIYDYLRDNGYSVQDRKARRAFCIDFSDNEGNAAFVSIPRHNQTSYENNRSILRRERNHAREKIIEGRTETYVVAAPEDIIVRKLSRAVNRLSRNPLYEQYASSMKNLSDEEIQNRLEYLKQLREAVFTKAEPGKTEEFLRFMSDLYDIRLLSELSGVNKRYFRSAFKSWDSLKTSPNDDKKIWKISLITRATLPDDLISFRS